MTLSDITAFEFSPAGVSTWAPTNPRNGNWPVVYVLDGSTPEEFRKRRESPERDVYVGESINAIGRMRQHLDSLEKQHLDSARVIVDETFNKSVCLDLESYLIRMLAGDGGFRVLNRNDGITNADYFDREHYLRGFRGVFDELRAAGVFSRSISEIENSDLFKLSPFKALTQDQAIAVEDIVEGLLADLEAGHASTTVIQGEPGTGKTVVAIFMLKLLRDIATSDSADEPDADSLFSDFFVAENRELLTGLRVGFVVPQQSLRESIKRVFSRTPGLSAEMVVNPFEVGSSSEMYDLLIVDEAHRLSQRANQPSGPQNKRFREITTALFGDDDVTKTQLDWLESRSHHRLLMIDAAQSVRPADLDGPTLAAVLDQARSQHRSYRLSSQMRVRAGADYVGFMRRLLGVETASVESPSPDFGEYDLRLFDDVGRMRKAILERESESGLSRMLAGYAWEWRSKGGPDDSNHDIVIGDVRMHWNSTDRDWVASLSSIDEVGSIHTIQGYDLNYAGVIIGPDLRFNPSTGALYIDRSSYFDKKGKENNKVLGRVYSDDDLRRYISNIYAVLLTRGIRGTYVYAVDPGLRTYLARHLPLDR